MGGAANRVSSPSLHWYSMRKAKPPADTSRVVIDVRTEEGWRVGPLEGARVGGKVVGPAVGAFDGTRVGPKVGGREGLDVGAVGVTVGLGLGALVGWVRVPPDAT